MNQSRPSFGFALDVIQRLQRAGFQALLAGGCVRDQLMARQAKDYDVATDATPKQVRDLFGRRRTLAIGASFGVVAILGPRGVDPVEVATFRSEGEYSDGRHPDRVVYSSAEQDAQRRDFTINGLFLDPVTDQVLDYVGGQVDLQRRLIRCIGDPGERIAEDKLRMLRAIRFGATLDFEVDRSTLDAITDHALELKVVSAERILAEMRHILTEHRRAEPLRQLRQTGLCHVVLPEYTQVDEVDSADPPWDRMVQLLQHLEPPRDFDVALAAMLWPLARRRSVAPMVTDLAQRWRLPNQDRDQSLWLLRHVDLIRRSDKLPWPELQPVLVNSQIQSLLTLTEAVIRTETQDAADLGPIEHCRRRLELPLEQLDPVPLVNGHDLIQAGIPRGRQIGQLLKQIREQQLNGQLNDARSAIDWAKRLG